MTIESRLTSNADNNGVAPSPLAVSAQPTPQNAFAYDAATGARFLTALMGTDGGFYEFRCFRECEEKVPPEKRDWILRVGEEASGISFAIKNGWHVYVGVAARQKGRGTKKDLTHCRFVFCEIDFKDFAGGEAEARERLAAYPIAPHIVVMSGGGLQC